MIKVVDKVLRMGEGKKLKKLEAIVASVAAWESEISRLSDEALRAKTPEFMRRFDGGETLDDLLPEAFAVAREAARRATGMRPFDVQVMGAVVLHQGSIAEMKTGEGKTLVATMPVYLNALAGRGVHLVTVNDYLARRDAAWMGQVYGFLGLLVLSGAVLHILAGIRNYLFRSRMLGIVALIAGMVTTLITCYCAPTAVALGVYGLVCYLNPEVTHVFGLVAAGKTKDEILGSFG